VYAKAVEKIHFVFNNEKVRKFLGKLRVPLCLVFFILLVLHIKPSFLLPGFIVSLFGELIQVWCFATLDKNRTLTVRGLYCLTRNPMYLGRFFLILGALIATGNIWIIVIFCFVYYFYMVNRVRREEAVLRSVFGQDYDVYCSKVSRFLLSRKMFRWTTLGYFNWRLLKENHGHWNILAMLFCYFVFYLSTLFRSVTI
jgi:protein-S-isoprenylcysteine O-methyltransferase Ste14